MIKLTQKQLKGLVKNNAAIDLSQRGTILDREEVLRQEDYLKQIGYAASEMGCTGKLLQGHKTKQLYVIIGHVQAIYVY